MRTPLGDPLKTLMYIHLGVVTHNAAAMSSPPPKLRVRKGAERGRAVGEPTRHMKDSQGQILVVACRFKS